MAAPTDEAAGSGTPGSTDSFLADWRERIILPAVAAGESSPFPSSFTFLGSGPALGRRSSFKFCRFGCCAGVLGAAFGLLSRHRARLGAARAAVTYAANLAIVAGCYGGEVSVP
jgi:hypothetical protein